MSGCEACFRVATWKALEEYRNETWGDEKRSSENCGFSIIYIFSFPPRFPSLAINQTNHQVGNWKLNFSSIRQLFKPLRDENPRVFDKLVPVRGDVETLGIGLTPESLKLLENVSIIFHSAASVRFDDILQYAIILNTRGTREVAEFALKLKQLAVFVHISTTFCYPQHQILEEKVKWDVYELFERGEKVQETPRKSFKSFTFSSARTNS